MLAVWNKDPGSALPLSCRFHISLQIHGCGNSATLPIPVLSPLQYGRGWSTLLEWGKELHFTLDIYSFIMVLFSVFHLASHVFPLSWITRLLCTKIFPHSKLCIPANSNQPVPWLRFLSSLIFILFWIEASYAPMMNLPPHKNRGIIVTIAFYVQCSDLSYIIKILCLSESKLFK